MYAGIGNGDVEKASNFILIIDAPFYFYWNLFDNKHMYRFSEK